MDLVKEQYMCGMPVLFVAIGAVIGLYLSFFSSKAIVLILLLFIIAFVWVSNFKEPIINYLNRAFNSYSTSVSHTSSEEYSSDSDNSYDTDDEDFIDDNSTSQSKTSLSTGKNGNK